MGKARKFPVLKVANSDAKPDKEKIRKGGNYKRHWSQKKTAK